MADNDINKQLLTAAMTGNADMARDLIQTQGADQNHARTFDSATPILMAAMNGHVEVVRALGELGADPNKNNNGETPIWMAALFGHVDVVRALGELGADPNLARTDDAETSIFVGAWNALEVVRALLELGADPNIANSFGKTPLDIAVECDDVVMQRLLETPVPQPHRQRIRTELDDTIEEVQIIEMVADFVGPMCDPKRRKAYIAQCAEHRAEMKKKHN